MGSKNFEMHGPANVALVDHGKKTQRIFQKTKNSIGRAGNRFSQVQRLSPVCKRTGVRRDFSEVSRDIICASWRILVASGSLSWFSLGISASQASKTEA